MIIRVNSSVDGPVVISAVHGVKVEDDEAEQQAKALAYVLAKGLPSNVFRKLYEHVGNILYLKGGSKFFDEYVAELKRTAETYEVK